MAFYGIGYEYPFKLLNTGLVAYVIEEDDVKQSIEFLMETTVGSLFFIRNMGTTIKKVLFKNASSVETINAAIITSCQLLSVYETRIERPTGKILSFSGDSLEIEIRYSLKSTGQENFIVIPYRLNEF